MRNFPNYPACYCNDADLSAEQVARLVAMTEEQNVRVLADSVLALTEAQKVKIAAVQKSELEAWRS